LGETPICGHVPLSDWRKAEFGYVSQEKPFIWSWNDLDNIRIWTEKIDLPIELANAAQSAKCACYLLKRCRNGF